MAADAGKCSSMLVHSLGAVLACTKERYARVWFNGLCGICSQVAEWERPPILKKGQDFAHAVVGMEAEIDAVAHWRKDQGQGKLARSRRGFDSSCCETYGLQSEWDQLSNLVHKVYRTNLQKVH